ncbi:Putative transition state regulator Abh [Paraliobacillus sp. PM-2]|uniref:AbrB/MazE/SpoVT family DNA-binding domain-containing protein n=1 Tax=Paraliobacillus sp. PM-2 TaxID=1462524 RepID=UPI00061CA8C0|nr:AbrB/MazE/SpoVT family DNA-binding domain-containing protein [Paraliobacillus sp. PM-2]CQR46361.1 Putative transition state regulator Abh [Paraliobacillus sp. PM-2]
MKSTGIVRKTDHLGRIVLPKELRTSLNIANKDPLEIFTDSDRIVLRKFNSNRACMITGEVSDQNQSFFDGKITLSPRGIELLQKELQS